MRQEIWKYLHREAILLSSIIYIADPQGIKEIFSADAKSFDAGRTNDFVRPCIRG
ncbi:MAG: hypothetical protein QNJ55_14080 [Xenococcus sp. MO_188.B8]|nr:hypothetical protein [Xenococcus sp. MO_188.B8]